GSAVATKESEKPIEELMQRRRLVPGREAYMRAMLACLQGRDYTVNLTLDANETYYFNRRVSDALLNLFAMKMAAVFMFSTCTIVLRTAIFPRWVAFLGYACALVLLVVIANWKWITLVFPVWMLVVRAQILSADFRSRHAGTAGGEHHQA